ncbi:AAA domain-containing protein [Hydrogenophaga sp. BPS33]|uniref:AAA domain-containing protein n=1 Tax=Hydrogenophaga sp. BPS33 TaxID=2651974 RepID=UPI00135C3EF8|nr:AAA domain-containing protein [Hydrogenophaga sp. BPS33]
MDKSSQSAEIVCGRYEVVEALKPGGMARVFRVKDRSTQLTLALKLPMAPSTDAQATLAFNREREALEELRHPNIVQLVDSGRTDEGELFLALEWLPTCLSEKLAEGRRWTWEDFYVDVGAPLVSALAAAHKRYIAHRDIKPDNLRFDEFGMLKVTDFGIAKARGGVGIGETFKHAGSPPYTPPEADDGTNSFARDSYSWAAVALTCLTGTTFANYDEVKYGLAALSARTSPLEILQRCLSLSPLERPANATDLQMQLDAFHREFTDGRPLQITVQISTRDLSELAQKLGDRRPDETLILLRRDLNGSLHAYIVNEEDRTVRLLGATLDVTCKALDDSELFRIQSVRLLEPERAEKERRLACELRMVTVDILAPLSPARQAGNQRAFWLRLQTEEGHRSRERDRVARERWFDCWAAVLREKERIQKSRRLRINFTNMRSQGNNAVAHCEGELNADALPESLVFKLPSGRPLFFAVHSVFGEEITLRPLNLNDDPLPKGPGVLESNYHAESQPVSRQRTALENVRRDRAASPDLKTLLCHPASAREPDQGGLPPDCAKDLNDEKRALLELALGVNGILILEGPPGTGKTTFIAELIGLYLNIFPAARILLSSQTHTALDHVIVKLLEKGMEQVMVRIHGERLEKIDERALPLTLDIKTRTWIERVEERAREHLRAQAKQVGLNAEEVEVVVLGEQRHILLAELREQQARLAILTSSMAEKSTGEEEDAEVTKTSTLLDEQTQVAEQVKILQRRLKKVDEKLYACGAYGQAVASQSDEISKEWMEALSKPDAPDAEVLKRHVELQLEWFSRLGASKNFHGAVLGEARVVAGTCVGLGSVQAIGEQVFDLCIVDEVSKATPTETLIPMSRSKRWVLVGDPKQLPPYSELDRNKVLEQRFPIEEAEATLLDILTPQLPRLCKAQLTEQRRMVGGIGRLISEVFYEGKLVTIRKAEDRNPVAAKLHGHEVEWHTTAALKQRRDQEMPGRTYRNATEATIVYQILERLNDANRGRAPLSVAVIAGYSAQVNELDQRLRGTAKPLQNLQIDINTVHAFQGKDADICIYSVTRSNDRGRLGFQRETPLLNVALSRGRDALIIVGDDDFCRSVNVENPFRPVLAHIDNNPAECAIVCHDRI